MVRAKPNSKRSSVCEINEEAVEIAIGAPATEGKANSELVDFLSSILKVKKKQISLTFGEKNKNKVISINPFDQLTLESVFEILKKEMD